MAGSHAGAGNSNKKNLFLALLLTLSFMAAEIVGGIVTGSLALIADAAHMMTDAGGLAFALIAMQYAERPATPQRTYGYVRLEVLAALANAVILILVAVYVLWEAYKRFSAPPEILSTPMLAVAAIGLCVNLISMRLLAGGSEDSLNMKGAYYEVLGDMLGSIGVIAAALIVMFTGWTLADPIIGAGIGLFIIPRTWSLLKQAVAILMEGTPPEIDVTLIEKRILTIPGVAKIHDLHVWTLTSGLDAMSAHFDVDDNADGQAILLQAREILSSEFKLTHTTIQLDAKDFAAGEPAHRV